jgi:hypothetical protein
MWFSASWSIIKFFFYVCLNPFYSPCGVLKYENHKIRERKVKTLIRNWRDHQRTGTHKNTETESRHFDRHSRLFQSEESKCLWTHDKDGVTPSLSCVHYHLLSYDWKRRPCLSKYTPSLSCVHKHLLSSDW